jgi:RimJ/RimL family protein N-acetyltransferase
MSMRPLSEGDAALFCELYGDPETMRFVGPALSRERAQRSFQFILTSRDSRPARRLFMAIVEKASQRAIEISAFQRVDTRHRRVETGMMLDSVERTGSSPTCRPGTRPRSSWLPNTHSQA